jgi:hypothetical protein
VEDSSPEARVVTDEGRDTQPPVEDEIEARTWYSVTELLLELPPSKGHLDRREVDGKLFKSGKLKNVL